MYQKNTQHMTVNWNIIKNYLSLHSVPDNRIDDVCSFIASMVEAGNHINKQDVPDDIDKVFNGVFTFGVLDYVIEELHDVITYDNVTFFELKVEC